MSTPDWLVKALADVDSDGFLDVVFQNRHTGTSYFADMNDGEFDGWGTVASGLGGEWMLNGGTGAMAEVAESSAAPREILRAMMTSELEGAAHQMLAPEETLVREELVEEFEPAARLEPLNLRLSDDTAWYEEALVTPSSDYRWIHVREPAGGDDGLLG